MTTTSHAIPAGCALCARAVLLGAARHKLRNYVVSWFTSIRHQRTVRNLRRLQDASIDVLGCRYVSTVPGP